MAIGGLPPVAFAATLRDGIAQAVRGKILDGSLTQGSKLDIDELAATFGSSRTPVREALIELSHQGLVEIVPRRGIRVVGMSPEKVRDTFAVFGGLSGMAAAWTARNADAELVARLRSINDDIRGDAESVRENFELHRAINRACGSPRLLGMISQLSSAMPTEFFRLFPEQTDVSHAEHNGIIDAIEAHDESRARELAEAHMQAAGDRMVSRMISNEAEASN